MERTYWTLTLMPGEGWIVRRCRQMGRGTIIVVAEYDRLTRAEAHDVLDCDLTTALRELADELLAEADRSS